MHAYLIIANRNFNQLGLLLSTLDDPRNDIYLQIDAKARFKNLNALKEKVKQSNLFILKPIKIFWGSYSQIDAELRLFKQASSFKEYDYYHLLSGLDLPLKSQDELHEFMDENQGKEFLTFTDASIAKANHIVDRLDYHVLPNISSRSFKTRLGKKMYRGYRKLERLVEHQFNIRVNQLDCPLGYGSNWLSIDHSLVLYVLKNKKWIQKYFKHSMFCDEIFIHTLVINSHFKDNVYVIKGVKDRPEDVQGNLRYINWWDGSPYTWRITDWSSLKKISRKNYFFARKFDEQIDKFIVKKIVNSLD